MSQKTESAVAHEVMESRRNGMAYALGEPSYYACGKTIQLSIDRIIKLQDQIMAGERKEAREVYDNIVSNLNGPETVTLALSKIKAGTELTDGTNRYVLVPMNYEAPNIDIARGVVECGSGPETTGFRLGSNPNWAWQLAGNAAACARVIEQREKLINDRATMTQ